MNERINNPRHVCVQVGMPDAEGRLQIVEIHTTAMRRSGRVTPEAERRLGELVGCVRFLVCRDDSV